VCIASWRLFGSVSQSFGTLPSVHGCQPIGKGWPVHAVSSQCTGMWASLLLGSDA